MTANCVARVTSRLWPRRRLDYQGTFIVQQTPIGIHAMPFGVQRIPLVVDQLAFVVDPLAFGIDRVTFRVNVRIAGTRRIAALVLSAAENSFLDPRLKLFQPLLDRQFHFRGNCLGEWHPSLTNSADWIAWADWIAAGIVTWRPWVWIGIRIFWIINHFGLSLCGLGFGAAVVAPFGVRHFAPLLGRRLAGIGGAMRL